MATSRIGENIRYFRKLKRLTQKQLGELCGMQDSAIRRYENSGSTPKDENLKKIADALGVSTFQLKMRGIEKTKEWRDATALDDFLSSFGIDVYYEQTDPDKEDTPPMVYLQGDNISIDMSWDKYEAFKNRMIAYAKHLIDRTKKEGEADG